MASKVWKKLLFFILIIACLFNITIKLVKRNSFKEELQSSAQYVQNLQLSNNIENINNEVIIQNQSN